MMVAGTRMMKMEEARSGQILNIKMDGERKGVKADSKAGGEGGRKE